MEEEERWRLAGLVYEGEVKVRVIRKWGKFTHFNQLERQKREIAGRFRDNVRISKGFEAIRRNCRQNTACYRVGWVLARHLSTVFLSVLQSLHRFPPVQPLESPSPASSSLSPLRELRTSSRSVKRSTFLISQLVVNKPVLRKLAGLLLRTAFERLREAQFRGNSKDLGKTYSLRAGEETGNSHSGEVAKKTAELSQRVASILQLIEAKKAETASEQPSSRSSLATTPRRTLNLRIPNQSSLSTTPLSPSSEEKPAEDSIYADLTQLRRKERTLQVWKQWKAALMRGKLRKLKVEIGLKSRQNRLLRPILAALLKWTNYKRGKKQWVAIAVRFQRKSLLSQSFQQLRTRTSRLHLCSLASQHHTHRSLSRLITLWAQYAQVKALREAKVRSVLDRVEDRIRYKYIAVWKLAGKLSAGSRRNSEKALFCWYEREMPRIWKALKQAVQRSKIAGKMRQIAERLRGSRLVRTFFPLWRATAMHSSQLKQRKQKLQRFKSIQNAHLALKRLCYYAKSHKKERKYAEIAENQCSKVTTLRTLQRFRQRLRLKQAYRALRRQIAEAQTYRLGKEAWKSWKLRVKRKMYETNTISASKSRRKTAFMRFFLLNWQIALRNRLSKWNAFAKSRSISALRVSFQSIKQLSRAKRDKKALSLCRSAAMLGSTLTRLVSTWRRLVEKQQKYRRNRVQAERVYLEKVYRGWRQRCAQVRAVRTVLGRRLQREHWDWWVGCCEEFATQERMQNKAERHFRLWVMRRIFAIWTEKHEKKRKFELIKKQIQNRGRKLRLKGLFQAWTEAIPKLQRRLRMKRLASDFATFHCQHTALQLLLSLQSHSRKSLSLRTKTSQHRLRGALSAFQRATSASLFRHRTLRSLLVKAKSHLQVTRSLRALTALGLKIARKQMHRTLLSASALARVKTAWLHWQSYRQRYFAVMRKAGEFRQRAEANSAVETFQRLKTLLESRERRENLYGKVSLCRTGRLRRVVQAWHGVLTRIKTEKEVIFSLRRKVILKSCLTVIFHNCRLLKTIKTFMFSQVSASDSKLKRLSIHSFQRNTLWNRCSKAIQSHHRTLSLRLSLLSWQSTAKSNKMRRVLLRTRFRQWTSRKQYERVMAYVQPRLRGAVGSKLTALWKWKLALSAPTSHSSMGWLPTKSRLVLGLWKEVAVYMSLYRQLQVSLFRRRVLRGRGWAGWRTRVAVGRLRLKKQVTAALFSDLKREIRAFQGWKRLRPNFRTPSVPSRKGVSKVC